MSRNWMQALMLGLGLVVVGLSGCGEESLPPATKIDVIVKDRYTDTTADGAQREAENLMPKIKQAQGVFTSNEPTTYGMLKALRSAGLAGKIKFVGFDGGDPLIDGLRKGEIDALVLQNPKRMGYLAVMTMAKALKGEKVDERVDTGVAVVTKDDVDKPDMADFVKPDITVPDKVEKVEGKAYRIAMVPKGTTHVFWKTVEAGARQAEAELRKGGMNVTITWKGPTKENDRGDQIALVEQYVKDDSVDGIILAPLDDEALVKPVRGAADKKKPVVIFDSALKGDAGKDFVSFVATDNKKGGVMGGEKLAALLGGKGYVVMLRYQQGSASTDAREEGCLQALEAANKK